MAGPGRRRALLLLVAISLPLASAACGSAPAASPASTTTVRQTTTTAVTKPAVFAVFADGNANTSETAKIRERLIDTATIVAFRYLDRSQSYQLMKQIFGNDSGIVEGMTPATTPSVFECKRSLQPSEVCTRSRTQAPAPWEWANPSSFLG
jgi:cell division protein FtsX